jgi:phage gp16-like protein
MIANRKYPYLESDPKKLKHIMKQWRAKVQWKKLDQKYQQQRRKGW